MGTPDFIVVGNVTRDVVRDGWRMGGTVTFAAVQAERLGNSVGVLTRAPADIDVAAALPFAQVVQLDAATATTFENSYEGGRRQQHIRSAGEAILATDLPEPWRAAPIVLLGPVFGEVAPTCGREFSPRTVVGVSAQGWLRSADAEGRVVHTRWAGEPFWRGVDVLFVSDEDLADGGEDLERWCAEVPAVAMTESWRGARVYSDGRWRRMAAFPETEVDPTGAGDTFATAFLIRLHETGDIDEAARFGAAAASLSVGGVGLEAVPTRAEVEARLRSHPEVVLR